MDHFKTMLLSVDSKLQSGKSVVHESLSGLDPYKQAIGRFEHIEASVSDLIWDISKLSEGMDSIEMSQSTDIEMRISKIDEIKGKYKKDIKELLTYKEIIKEKLGKQDWFIHERKVKEEELLQLKQMITTKAEEMSRIRRVSCDEIIKKIQVQLQKLRLEKAEVVGEFKEKKDLDIDGLDHFEFLVKMNLGGVFSPLNSLSGGESSRVVLAFKSVLVDTSPIQTYILDEIDSGVSGEISQKLSEVISEMSGVRQMIVITHLPIVALSGNKVYRFSKMFVEDQTVFKVVELKKDESLPGELAFLISNNNNQEEAISYLRSLN